MPYYSVLTKEDLQQIINLAKNGETYTNIANLLGNKVSRQRIKQICAARNIDAKSIRSNKKQKEFEERMTAKWGKEWDNESVRRSYIYQAMRAKFRCKKANATRLGYNFTIDFGDIDFPTHCPILGIELNYFTEHGWEDSSPSFDRIDPKKDYCKGNVAVISMRANRIKNDGTAEEHEKIAQFIRKYS